MNQFKLKFLFLLAGCFLMGGTALFGQRQISGTVTDAETGEGLIGASVKANGVSAGATTDLSGAFRLSLPDGVTELVVSYTGYTSQTVAIGASNTVNVQLQSGSVLNELLVIGYGTVKREDATGSVTSVNTQQFNRGAITGAQELLAGKISGVQITTSGEPGGSSQIRIRGGSSLSASNDPLIVIDGVPVSNESISGSRNALNILNPNDIETFTVLKDASATAIYGSRASNGVILITTKKGSSAKEFAVNYNGSIAFSEVAQTADVLSADEFRSFVTTRYGATSPQAALLGNANTDWQSVIFRTGRTSDHNLSLSGGMGNWPTRLSFGMTQRDGILLTDNFRRATAALNLSPSFLNNTLQFNVNLKAMEDKNRFGDHGAIGSAINYDPTQPVYSSESAYGGYRTWLTSDGSGAPNNLAPTNPLALLEQKNNNSKVNRFVISGSVDYRFWFLKDLRANLNLGYDRSNGNGTVISANDAAFTFSDGGGRNEVYTQERKNELLEFYLNYVKKLGRHKVDVMGGYSWQHFYRTNFNFATNGAGTKVLTPRNTEAREYYLLSLFGRANVTLFDDLLLTGTIRRDGTSRFAPDSRWGLFPAAAIAYKLLDRDKGTLSSLKLRLGWGVTGQQDVSELDYYPYLARYVSSFNNAQYQLGNTFYNTLRPQGYDANIKWEETTTYNAAVDYGFVDNRITGSLEVYLRKTTDLLNFIPVPAGTNLTNFITTNVGDLENRGVELSINTNVIRRPKMNWDFGVNFTANRNKITRLIATDDPNYLGVFTGGIAGGVGNTVEIHSVGHPTNSFFVFEQVYGENGLPIEGVYVDRNKDGQITPDDRYQYKKTAPDYFIGFTSNFNWGNFDFSFAGRSNLGNFVYNNNLSEQTSQSRVYGSTGYLLNLNAGYTGVGFETPRYFSDHFIRNASFLRFDHFTVGYNFRGISKKLSNLRIYAVAQNPILITKYDGIDPEVFNPLNPGIDNNIYPRARTYMFGLNLGF
jgi:TonB-dependent starch-binding outer membrane protein SusC